MKKNYNFSKPALIERHFYSFDCKTPNFVCFVFFFKNCSPAGAQEVN